MTPITSYQILHLVLSIINEVKQHMFDQRSVWHKVAHRFSSQMELQAWEDDAQARQT